MPRLPNFKRLYKNDYDPDDRSFIEKLSFPINIGFELLYDALNNKLTREDNLLANVVEVIVSVNANGVPTTTSSFGITNITKAQGIVVERATNITNPAVYPTSGVFLTWTQSRNTITIQHIAGLPANNQFQLRMAVYG